MTAQLERDGVRLAYERHGCTSAQPPLLLTHGYGITSQLWSSNVGALSSDRLAITWDLRGHGDSDAPADAALYSHDHSLQDMAALLDLTGDRPAVLVGMSLGGFLSLSFYRHWPERVAALVLVDTGPGFRSDEARERWNDWAREQADELLAGGSPGAHGLAHAARHMLTQQDSLVINSLGEISVPTLVVVGANDHQFLPAADVMERRIPGARKVVLAGAGHASNADAPQAFNTAVGEFLRE